MTPKPGELVRHVVFGIGRVVGWRGGLLVVRFEDGTGERAFSPGKETTPQCHTAPVADLAEWRRRKVRSKA